jgi:type I restriction enzyme M protein
MTEQKHQLEQQLWSIANTLRGKMDADDFRDYILGFIFYKYLSTKIELYANEILEPDNLKFRDLEGHSQEAAYLSLGISYCHQNYFLNWQNVVMQAVSINLYWEI